MTNRFFENIDVIQSEIGGVVQGIMPYFVLPLLIALVFVVIKLTDDDPFIDEKRIIMMIISVVLLVNYSEVTYHVAAFCNGLNKDAYGINLKSDYVGSYDSGGGTYVIINNDAYIVGRKGKIKSGINRFNNWFDALLLPGVSAKDLETVTDNYDVISADSEKVRRYMKKHGITNYEEAVAQMYSTKGFAGITRKVMTFIQFVWATLLYFLGVIFVLLSPLNTKFLTRFLAEFVAINLWPLIIKLIDFVKFTFMATDGFDGSFHKSISFAYIFAPLMVSILIPGTVSNTVLQRVTGLVGVGAGMAGMVARGGTMAARKIFLKF